jgi:hypothetical protein|tara:strand:+ start:913 stop:1083 length:171 start_codon:yes stop_codon:yes gene_type:complete
MIAALDNLITTMPIAAPMLAFVLFGWSWMAYLFYVDIYKNKTTANKKLDNSWRDYP